MARGKSRQTRSFRPTLDLVFVVLFFERAAAQNAFTRATGYQKRVCTEQPGSYDVALSDGSTSKRATCVSLDAGELKFCSGIAHDACVRYDPPVLQDDAVAKAFDRMARAQAVMAPELAGDLVCLEIMAKYMCAVAFPKCDPDPVNLSKHYEIPVCWDYCVDSVFGCMGERKTAFDVCNRSVHAGIVNSQDRPDVKCLAGGSAAVKVVFVAVMTSLVLVFLVGR